MGSSSAWARSRRRRTPPRSRARSRCYNGKEAIGIDVKKSKGYSTTDVAHARARSPDAARSRRCRAGTKIDLVKDSGVRVEHAVSNVEEALILGAMLTVLVVFLFLNSWRSTVITGLALPISVLASFIAVWALGFKLETMSLLGLSLAIGILIDDAIVVRENIVRHVEMGKDHFHGGARRHRRDRARRRRDDVLDSRGVRADRLHARRRRPVVQAVRADDRVLGAVSLFVSFSLDPMLSAYWPDPHKAPNERGWITRQLDRFNALVQPPGGELQARHRVGARSPRGDGDDGGADLLRVVRAAQPRADRLAAALVGIAIIVFGLTQARAAARSFARVAVTRRVVGVRSSCCRRSCPPMRTVGTAFFPVDDRAEFIMALETPPGSNIEYTRLKAEEAARIARAHPEVTYTYTTLGSSATGGVDEGNIYVRTVPKDKRSKSVEELAEELRQETKHVAGATVSVFTIGLRRRVQADPAPASRPGRRRARAGGRHGAGRSRRRFRARWTSGCRRRARSPSSRSISIAASPARSASPWGRSRSRCVRRSPASTPATGSIRRARSRKVTIRLTPESRQRASDLMNLPMVVHGPERRAVDDAARPGRDDPRRALARRSSIISNREPVVTVELNTAGRAAGDVTDGHPGASGEDAIPGRRALHDRRRRRVAGRGVRPDLLRRSGVAVLLMYLILVVQFGSFLDPLAILHVAAAVAHRRDGRAGDHRTRRSTS